MVAVIYMTRDLSVEEDIATSEIRNETNQYALLFDYPEAKAVSKDLCRIFYPTFALKVQLFLLRRPQPLLYMSCLCNLATALQTMMMLLEQFLMALEQQHYQPQWLQLLDQ